MPIPKQKPQPFIICADSPGDGQFSSGSTIDEAYENYCAYHRAIDIRTCVFYTAVEIPADQIPQGEDYD